MRANPKPQRPPSRGKGDNTVVLVLLLLVFAALMALLLMSFGGAKAEKPRPYEEVAAPADYLCEVADIVSGACSQVCEDGDISSGDLCEPRRILPAAACQAGDDAKPCLEPFERAALGGDPVAQFELLEHFRSGDSPAGGATLVQSLAWSGLLSCGAKAPLDAYAAGRIVRCPVPASRRCPAAKKRLEEIEKTLSQGSLNDRSEARARHEAARQAMLNECNAAVTKEACVQRIRDLRDIAREAYPGLSGQASQAQRQESLVFVRESLSGMGRSGVTALGELYRDGCLFSADKVEAAAAFLAAETMDSSYAQDQWTQMKTLLTPNEQLAAQQRMVAFMGSGGELQADTGGSGKGPQPLQAELIETIHVQAALAALGHYGGVLDNDMGAGTLKAIEEFKICQNGVANSPTLNTEKGFGKSGDRKVPATFNALDAASAPEASEMAELFVLAARGGRGLGQATPMACHEDASDKIKQDRAAKAKASPRAQFIVGSMLMSGVGLSRDLDEAEASLNQAKDDFPPAHVALAYLYREHRAKCDPANKGRYEDQAKIHETFATEALGRAKYKDRLRHLYFDSLPWFVPLVSYCE